MLLTVYKIWQWVESNRGPWVSEATALPTDPQPLSKEPTILYTIMLIS